VLSLREYKETQEKESFVAEEGFSMEELKELAESRY
jgi:hypothetical protein